MHWEEYVQSVLHIICEALYVLSKDQTFIIEDYEIWSALDVHDSLFVIPVKAIKKVVGKRKNKGNG